LSTYWYGQRRPRRPCGRHVATPTKEPRPGAELELGFLAQDVYLVLGGTGTLDVSVNGHHTQTIDVGGIPRLYTLYQAGSATSGTLLLHASPGVQAYDFTFG
jgi:Thioredoxin like C-terminal domain